MPGNKSCLSCGRTIAWRKKWEKNWEEIRYCSARCRRSKPTALDRKLEEAIQHLLSQRKKGATICPSEAARAVLPDEEWRNHMEQTRRAARRLVASGSIEILQKGHIIDASTAKGPIRLRTK